MQMRKVMEDICLKHDNGCDFTFRGRLFSECSWYDEGLGMLTRQKLYVTDHNEQVYYIVRSSGQERSRHAYKLRISRNGAVFSGPILKSVISAPSMPSAVS